ncbi:MAG: hypothetical protein JSW34_01025 [Candidatus Zixiibacteriota bacterium]|nr:MAG: hypothetical protein JSW34_01025 [candidate division Zixibacteria bacterium]
MTRKSSLVLVVLLLMPVSVSFGLERVDVSPMVLINLSETGNLDAGSRLLGGAVAGDFYFSRHFALRASVGYVKSLYNTSVSRIDQLFADLEPVSDPQYGLRFSIAPYAEADIAGRLKPYIALSGGVGHTGGATAQVADIRAVQGDVISNSTYLRYNRPGGSYYDFSGSVGFKMPVARRLSVFAELTHRLYSSFDDNLYNPDAAYRQVPFGFDDYKTFLSTGLTYSIGIGT